MTADERQFLLTAAWMFMRHGQPARARTVCAGEATRAVEVLRAADVPPELAHAAAFLETRALRNGGRNREAANRWSRYIESRKGTERRWV